MNYYFAYGLSIATDIDFPELFVITPTTEPDINVRIGTVPTHHLEKAKDQQTNIFITSTEYFLHIDSVASYYVTSGNEVIIEPIAGTDRKSIRLFFLSNAMAAILYQRGNIPMHASAIYDNNGIVLFMGDSGAGKSTTVATLQVKGYRVFSDDICVPVQEHDVSKAFAAYPIMKLWKDTFGKISIGSYQEENRILPESEKYGKSFYESFETKAQPIRQIFILEKDPSIEAVQSKSIQGIEAFKHLQYYAYRLPYIEAMDMKKAYFTMLSILSNHIPVILISRPENKNTIHEVVQLIENHLVESTISGN